MPSRTERLESWFAVARSGIPSPFRSPLTMAMGDTPMSKSVLAANVPSPLPSSTDTVVNEKFAFAVARSLLPSPFRSRTTREMGSPAVPKIPLGRKVPSPLPRSTATALPPRSDATRSG